MQYHFYTVEDGYIEQMVMAYLRLKQMTTQEHEKFGRTETFQTLGVKTTEAYAALTVALGLKQAYLKYKNATVRSLKVERSSGRTMLAVPKPLKAESPGLREITEADYISMRHVTMRSLGLLPKIMSNNQVPH